MRWVGIAALALMVLPCVVASAATPRAPATTSNEHAGPDADWLNWLECSPKHCDRTMLEAYQRQHSHNAAVWMPDVAEALHRRDEHGAAAALRKMADGRRYFDGIYAHTRAKVFALLGQRSGSGKLQHAYAVYAIGMVANPALSSGLPRLCTPTSIDQMRRSPCARLGRLMQASDSQRSRLFGDTLVAYNAETPHERSAASADGLRIEWQEQQIDDLQAMPDCARSLERATIEAMRTSETQEGVVAHVLRTHGIPLQPPPGWRLLPPRPPLPPGAYTCGR